MTTIDHGPSQHLDLRQVPRTVADVIDHIGSMPQLSSRRRAELTSALRSMCRGLESDPAMVVADVRHLGKRLAGVSPARTGISARRLANVRSLALTAFREAGIRALPGRYRDPLPPAWEVLRAKLPDRHFKYGLSRLMGFCAANGVEPEDMTAETFRQFGAAISSETLLRDPGGVYRDACMLWNQAAARFVGWPQLHVAVPSRRHDFAMPMTAFPRSFQQDVATYLASRAEPDVFAADYHVPARPITLKHRRQHLIVLATALVASGFPINEVTSIGVLVAPDNAKAALRFLHDRASGKTPYVLQLATLLHTVARHHVGAPGADIALLKQFKRGLRPDSCGFTEKNRAFLRQMSDPTVVHRLLRVATNVIERIEHADDGRRGTAVQVELAVAVAVELAAPIRISNLAGLRPDRHLHNSGHGDEMLIAIPAGETKNDNALDMALPPDTTALVNCYIKKYRPRLCDGCPWLFPGEKGRLRQPGGFGAQLSRFIHKETGIRMTVHQFRHFAAKLYLDHHPGDYETVRRLLGHKNIATTIRFYQELDTAKAVHRYADVVAGLVAQHGAEFVKPRRIYRKRRDDQE
jgi:hypothetical protein